MEKQRTMMIQAGREQRRLMNANGLHRTTKILLIKRLRGTSAFMLSQYQHITVVWTDAQFVFMIACWMSAAHIFIYPVVHMWTPLQFFFFFMSLVLTLHLLMIFRNLLRKANMKLSQVLVEVLKTTAAAEETMGLHMQSLRDASGAAQLPHSTTQSANTEPLRLYNTGEQHQDSAVIQYWIQLLAKQTSERADCKTSKYDYVFGLKILLIVADLVVRKSSSKTTLINFLRFL